MTIESKQATFADGVLWLRTPWGTAAGEILVDGRVVREAWKQTDAHTWESHLEPWRLIVEETPGGFPRLGLINAGPESAHLRSVHFGRWLPHTFSSSLPTAEFRELIHGGSFAGLASGAKCVGRPTPFLAADAGSSMFTVYQRGAGPALLLGVAPPLGSAFSELATLHSAAHLEGDFGVEVRHQFDCDVEPGRSVATAPIVGLAGAVGTDLMQAYGDLWRDRQEKKPARSPRTGWNSWDYYAGAVTRQVMDQNLQAAAGVLGEGPHVLVIDEGWEQQWGTWEPNGKFGTGLEEYCRHVRAQGWIPGIWTAPLLVNTYNPLLLEHPEWFATRADGQIRTDSYSYGPMAYLDVTRPEVIDHVASIFRRLRSWGFEYFKVDFCHCILKAECFHDRRVGRADLVRRAFAAIRRVIGDQAYLLACGAPYESVVGLVDGVRATGDIHIHWGHVLTNAGALSAHWWMQGKLWNCDPDFLVVRGPETARTPYVKPHEVGPRGLGGGWLAGPEFSAREARTYALLVHLTGGDVFLSDPLHRLLPEAVEMLRAVRTPRAAAAVPVDLFGTEQDLPRIWISRTEEDILVGLFNWSDKPARIDFDPERHGLRGTPTDFWTGAPLAELPRRLPRRSGLGLLFSGPQAG